MARKKTLSELEYARNLVEAISDRVPSVRVAQQKSLLYAVSFDDTGSLSLSQDESGAPLRGRGKGFEQDILLYEEGKHTDTSVIPRVVVEVKLGGVNTHSAIVYSEKARRIKAVYPFVRFGFLMGGRDTVPGRVLRLGQEFDFALAFPEFPSDSDYNRLTQLLRSEVSASRTLGGMLGGRQRVSFVRRKLEIKGPGEP